MYGPTWNSSMPTTRSPSGPRMTTLALSAEQAAERSSAASAWHSEPPIVPAVAHDRVGDHVLGVAEHREVLGEQLGPQQVDVAGERADADLVALLADVGELGEVVDVDQVLGVRQPELHHRQQAVAAGDDARSGAALWSDAIAPSRLRRALVLE